MKPSEDINLLRFVQIQEFQMQAIMEYRLRMKTKKQEDIKNEDPSEVKFSCRGCSKDICTGRDIEIIENIHRVNVTPQFRWELLHPEPTSVALSCSSACLCRFVQNKNEMPLFIFFFLTVNFSSGRKTLNLKTICWILRLMAT